MTASGCDRPTPSRAKTSLAAGVGGAGGTAGVAAAAGAGASAALDDADADALAAQPTVSKHHKPTTPRGKLSQSERAFVIMSTSPSWVPALVARTCGHHASTRGPRALTSTSPRAGQQTTLN